MAGEPMANMIQCFRELLSSGKYADCTIRCEHIEYKLHKAVICPQSTFFDKAFSVEMKEKETSQITLEEDRAEAVKSMIDFFYSLDYQPSPPATGQQNNTSTTAQNGAELPVLVHHARVYALADKYDIRVLRDLAAAKFKKACELWWNNSEFPQAAMEVYSTTPEEDRGLRDIVVQTIKAHRELIDKPALKTVIRDTLLGYDLVVSSHQTGSAL